MKTEKDAGADRAQRRAKLQKEDAEEERVAYSRIDEAQTWIIPLHGTLNREYLQKVLTKSTVCQTAAFSNWDEALDGVAATKLSPQSRPRAKDGGV